MNDLPDSTLAPFIRRRPADPAAADPAGFWSLRAEAVKRVQDASGGVWTDYNLHDPGVTILEQVCYALTDLVVRADRSVAEHLAGPDGHIEFARLGLLLPQQVLPSRASTATDYRRLLLDRVPGIDDARVCSPRPAPSAEAIGGLHSLHVKLAIDVEPAHEAAHLRDAVLTWGTQRNLGEDLDEAVTLIERRRCHLQAEIEIGGSRSPAQVLADVYGRCALHVADRLRSSALAEWIKEGRSLEQIFTGPRPQRGCIDEADARAEATATLAVGDLGRLILAIDGVREVRALALRAGDDGTPAARLAWRGDGWALSLVTPGQQGFRNDVALVRNGHRVVVEATDLHAEFQALRLSQTAPGAAERDIEVLITQPRGRPAPAGEPRRPPMWVSVQEQFPKLYGLGQEGLSGMATPLERARRRQLQGYLTLFDQLMANTGAQIAHLAELFSPRARAPSYWYSVVGNDSVPDLESLYTRPRADIEAAVFASRDDAVGRRHRVLDLLLALYGQTYTQGALRRSLAHLGGDELENRLLDNKRDFLAQTEVLSRDRAAGFDIAKEHWDTPANTSGLQRCTSLLLGFRRCTARSLVGGLSKRGLQLVDDDSSSLGAPHSLSNEQLAALRPVPTLAESAAAAPATRWVGVGAPRWPASLVRCGATWSRYRLLPLSGRGHVMLMLQADNDGRRWWRLSAPLEDATEAASLATAIRRELLAFNDDAEGVHVVEHVLLRPRTANGPHRSLGLTPAFYTLRVSVVFADWSARAQDPSFQRWAEETVRLNTPAHVEPQCLWLGFEAMQDFEEDLHGWLEALRLYALAAPERRNAAALDEAACSVIRALCKHGAH